MPTPFSPSFLGGEARARAFLPDDFRDGSRRAEHVRLAAGRAVSPRTLGALKALSARLPASPAREAHLERLGAGRAAVVVTGQQVGLFTGPLYAFAKAASAIAVARALSDETGVPCVPVFWLQSEDHDFPEIDHCVVQPRKGDPVRLSLPAPPGDGRRSVSCLALGPEVSQALDGLAQALDGLPHRDEVLALLRTHYRPGAGWVDAFAGVMAEVFAAEGLVFLDPRDPALMQEVLPLHRRCFAEHQALSRALLEREAALEAAGFEVQVRVRPDVALPFVHAAGRDGPRERIAPQALPAGEVCFSSSALLRPLVQDTLLPTAAIVGGPGELNYFAQVGPLYAHLGLPMPMVLPRARFRVLDARTRDDLAALGRTAAELEVPRAQALASLGGTSGEPTPDAVERELLAAVEPVLASLPKDPRLGDAVELTRGTVARAAARLKARWAFARGERDQVLAQRVGRLQTALFPLGQPQERVYGLPSMAARHGLAEFKAMTFAKLSPFSGVVEELHP